MSTELLPEFSGALTKAEANLLETVAPLVRGVCGAGIISETPTRHESFAVRITKPDPADESFWSAHEFPCMAWKAVLVGAFRTREAAQRFLMLVIAGLPIINAATAQGVPVAGAIQKLRISSIEEIVPVEYTEENEPKPWAWTSTINLDIVFLTGSRDVVSM